MKYNSPYSTAAWGQQAKDWEQGIDYSRMSKERLRRAQEGADKPYVLSASIGYTLCDRPENDSNAVLVRADEMLYRSKQQWHQESGRPTRK